MKKLFVGSRVNLSVRSFVGVLAALALVLSAATARAQVITYTDYDSFANDLSGPAYFEPFTAYKGQVVVGPQLFSFGGYSYTLSDTSGQIFYSSGTGSQGSVFPSTFSSGESLTLTFTSGNVTAVGGTFFLTDSSFNPLAGGSITATLNSGQTITETSTGTYGSEPFFGFTSSVPILSITLTAPTFVGQTGSFASLDKLFVGPSIFAGVPEPATWSLLFGGMVLLVGIRRVSRSRA